MKKIALIIVLAGIVTAAWANPPGSGETNGHGCIENCGHGGGESGGPGGSGGAGGNASGVGIAGAAAGAIAGASAGAGSSSSANASNIAQAGASSNDIRSFALSGGSVGSPSNDTCAAHTSIFFGLATFPITLPTCLAERQALLLWSFGQKEAALQRLCAIPEVAETSACPKKLAE